MLLANVHVVEPPYVLDPKIVDMQRALDRQKGSERKVSQAQERDDALWVVIADKSHLSDNAVAMWLRANEAPLVKHLTDSSLTKKIGKLRRDRSGIS